MKSTLAMTFGLLYAVSAHGITIDTVPIGNPGNPGDTEVMTCCDSSIGTSGYGSVGYNYRIGTTEVTNAQYAAFLNAKATSDPLGLYSFAMGCLGGGIIRSGSSPNFTYTTVAGRSNWPVNYVVWYNAIRFANWLNNGQGDGDTESGAYTLEGGAATPSNGLSITRNPGATWFLPSENEWYKAAYHKNDGVTSNYFQFPTSSDTTPTAEAPPAGNNSANYNFAVQDQTSVGAYTGTKSAYGAFDLAGNVFEWNEALISGSSRASRGGASLSPAFELRSSFRTYAGAGLISKGVGFRVATLTIVPEPSAGVILIAPLSCLLARRWRPNLIRR